MKASNNGEQHRGRRASSEVVIAPIERLEVPINLSGASGQFRMPAPCYIQASTDLEAILTWLSEYQDRPETYKAYKTEVERLINWALIERNKPISSLDEADLDAYEEFLADPQPRSRWIHPRGVPRTSSNWTPFLGALHPTSRLCSFSILRNMLTWLRDRRYCAVWLGLARYQNRRSPRGNSALSLSQRKVAKERIIALEHWNILWRAARAESERSGDGRPLLAIELMYFAGMTQKQLMSLQANDISECGGVATLSVGYDKVIYLAPPLASTLIRHCCERGLGLQRDSRSRAVASTQGNAPVFALSRSMLAHLLRGCFQKAAEHARSVGNEQAARRLIDLTPRSLTHAFEAHSTQRGCEQAIWDLIGAHYFSKGAFMNYMTRTKLAQPELARIFDSLSWAWKESAEDLG